LHLVEKRAKELEKRLEASEKARKEAKRKDVSVGDLQEKLNAAETALSEKEEHIAKRETAIIVRLDTQSARFSSNVSISFLRILFIYLYHFRIYIEKYLFFSRKNW
jgi:uncharacterized protein (DUF3084 family)